MQGLVGAFLVEFVAEAVEGPLLGGERAPRGATGAGFEGAVHPFVRAIHLRRRGVNALVLDAQPHPPDVELGEAMAASDTTVRLWTVP